MVCSHFTSINESLKATVTAMNHNLYNCELMDKAILDCTKNNRELAKNRFFLQGDPEAVLMLEVSANTIEEAEVLADNLIADLEKNNLGIITQKYMEMILQKSLFTKSRFRCFRKYGWRS